MRLLAILGVVLVLPSCASTKPTTRQDLVVAAPTLTSFLYPACHGCRVRVNARLCPRGSRTESLRIVATGRDGKPLDEAPGVHVTGGAPIQAITTDGSATVVWFGCPEPCDGSMISMILTAPAAAPCPYRFRITPVFKAP
jgi:hypothetical protein